MHNFFLRAFGAAWLITAAVWIIGALLAKPVERTQSVGSRLQDVFWAVVVFILLFHTNPRWLGPLNGRFVPRSFETAAIGLLLTVAGLAFAIWARFRLGGNWSARVTIKKDHTLVRRGPYSIVRHPIYSGILLALLGTALAVGAFRALIGFGVAVFFLKRKANLEERFMTEHFGAPYVEYRHHVKSLLPYVW